MIVGVVVFLASIGLYGLLARRLLKKRSSITLSIYVFWYHVAISAIYYLYALSNSSDSGAYYSKVTLNYRGDSWMDFYGTSTTFIEFLGYPFIKFLGFNYEAMMILFSFIGVLGFLFYLRVIDDATLFKHNFMGIDLVWLVLLFPNLHFWSASFGKGAVIFLGLGMLFFGLIKVRSRVVAVVLGSLIVYHVRPHVFLLVVFAVVISLLVDMKWSFAKTSLVVVCVAVLAFIWDDVQMLSGVEDLEDATTLDLRADKLQRATSAVDISNYNILQKLFTFWFRPLFFDAPGLLGFMTSIENAVYLILIIRLLSLESFSSIVNSGFYCRALLLSFFIVSLVLCQVTGNLGIALRQKSQIWILLFIALLIVLDQQKSRVYWSMTRRKSQVST